MSSSRFIMGPRAGHISASFSNWILIWGGTDGIAEERYCNPEYVYMYHSKLKQWLKKVTSGDIPPGTSGACSVVIENDIYVIGGHTPIGHTNSIYKLDLNSCTWLRMNSNKNLSPRDKFSAWFYEDKIFAFGGYGPMDFSNNFNSGGFHRFEGNYGWNNQICIYDLKSCEWIPHVKPHGKPPSPRAAHAAAQIGNKVFLFGGRHENVRMNDLHCFDSMTLTWSGLICCEPSIPTGRSWHSFIKISDVQLLLYGGYSTEGIALDDNWIFNIKTFTWYQKPIDNADVRLWHTMNLTVDKDVIMFGGYIDDILSDHSTITNKLCTYRFTPKSLYQYCIDLVEKYLDTLKSSFHSLPKCLLNDVEWQLYGILH